MVRGEGGRGHHVAEAVVGRVAAWRGAWNVERGAWSVERWSVERGAWSVER
jgi:hypothetical protein